MKIWTIQIAKWRLTKETDIEFIDTTVKSGLKLFAPTWAIVSGIKSGKITEDEYTEIYYNILRNRYRDNKNEFIKFCEKDKVAVGCYCPSGQFCHRHPLVDILEGVCKHHKINFERMGELE